MKTLRKLSILLIVLALGSNIPVLAFNSEKTETRNVRDFNSIKVSAGIDLYLKMGDSEEVKVIADENIIDKVITEVKDGTLKIYMKQNNGWGNWGNVKSRKVYVSVKELTQLHASSGSDVKSENTLTGETLKVNVSSGSDVTLDVHYKNFSVDTSSGSDARISGKTKNLEAEASSGSDIKAQDLESVICKVRVSSGSDATVNVSEEIYAKASSGGDVRYYGNPQIKDINESSGGDVTHK
ncbi:MAG TPA: head GIN domain-containing protein [Draconibacterium sp.]|nr:head GIN domain-containing protein [Draconibacterium sp.]